MRSQLLHFYRKSLIAKTLLKFPISVYKSLTARVLSDEGWCRDMFALCHGYALNLDNPRTLNEKINWLKLYNRRSDYTNWADKYKVRDYIRDIFGERYLIPLLAVEDDPRQIEFDALPEPYIIKSTHSSGHTIIVRNKSQMDYPKVVKQCCHWLSTNLYREGREWCYKNIPPKIVVEQLLLDEEGMIPLDYKFHCFNGKIAAIQVDLDRQTNHRRNFYDIDWAQLPFTWSVCAGDKPLWPQGRDIEKPTVLREMIEMTELLAETFSYVRIDWYVVANRIYFGEVTFHHGGGFERILPFEWDINMGDKLKLPNSYPCESAKTMSTPGNL